MLHTFSIADLQAELTEVARELSAADVGDRPALLALFGRIEAALNDRLRADAQTLHTLAA